MRGRRLIVRETDKNSLSSQKTLGEGSEDLEEKRRKLVEGTEDPIIPKALRTTGKKKKKRLERGKGARTKKIRTFAKKSLAKKKGGGEGGTKKRKKGRLCTGIVLGRETI